jgi:hypothetical protein
VEGSEEIEAAASEYKDWISNEVLARELSIGSGDVSDQDATHPVEIDGFTARVALTRDS